MILNVSAVLLSTSSRTSSGISTFSRSTNSRPDCSASARLRSASEMRPFVRKICPIAPPLSFWVLSACWMSYSVMRPCFLRIWPIGVCTETSPVVEFRARDLVSDSFSGASDVLAVRDAQDLGDRRDAREHFADAVLLEGRHSLGARLDAKLERGALAERH